jgi:hypothetical protein
MRRLIPTALFAALLAGNATLRADDYAFGFNPQTGDAWLDARLGDIGVYASGNLDGYVDEIVIETGAPRHYVEEWVYVDHYPPPDVWMLAEIGRLDGGNWIEVERTYTTHRGRGWGVIAKELGIKPGSPAFHELKSRAGGGHWAKVGKETGKGKGKGKGKGHGKGKPPKD